MENKVRITLGPDCSKVQILIGEKEIPLNVLGEVNINLKPGGSTVATIELFVDHVDAEVYEKFLHIKNIDTYNPLPKPNPPKQY